MTGDTAWLALVITLALIVTAALVLCALDARITVRLSRRIRREAPEDMPTEDMAREIRQADDKASGISGSTVRPVEQVRHG